MMDRRFRLDASESVLVIIDIQDRLARVMQQRQEVVSNVSNLIETARLFSIPVIVTEQYPKGLGGTVDELKDALADTDPIEKITFSCCDEERFMEALLRHRRKKVILTGMEAHVCVLQTCIDLLEEGYVVHVVSDAVTSRKSEDKETALAFMRDAGAVITCTETVMFQILKKAGTQEFRRLSSRIK